MKRGCLIFIVLYAALLFGYHRWLAQSVDHAPALWGFSALAAFFSLMCIGAIGHGWQSWGDARVVGAAASGQPPVHGRWCAVTGQLQTIGPPINAPFSGIPCVLYELEIARMVEFSDGDSPNRIERVKDFTGIAMTAAAIKSDTQTVRIYGVHDLEAIPLKSCEKDDDWRRAVKFVQSTNWTDCTGMKVFSGFRSMLAGMSANEESYAYYWRLQNVSETWWLKRDEPGPGEQTPIFSERRLTPGQTVTAIGRYDEEVGGLTSRSSEDGRLLRLYAEDAATVVRRLRWALWRFVVGGLIVLALINGIVAGVLQMYHKSGDPQRKWAQQLETAVKDNDVAQVQRLFERGLKPENAVDHWGATMLMKASDAAMIDLLVDYGVNPNAVNSDGETALMLAARYGNVGVLKSLLKRGADLNARNSQSQQTALIAALMADQHESAAVLREAGAADDIVTAKNSQPITATDVPYAICRDYILAIHARDKIKIIELSTPARAQWLDKIDWELWHNTRPIEPLSITGFMRGDDASVVVTGSAPRGNRSTWQFQLLRRDGRWHIAREHWVTDGVE